MKTPLTSQRLILRKPCEQDSEAYYEEIRKIPKYRKYAKSKKDVKERVREKIIKWNAQKEYNYTITFHNKIIGQIKIKNIDTKNKSAECGYWISPDYQRQGFGKEALQTLLTQACKKLNRIYFYTRERNIASQKLLQKIGAKKEGVLRESLVEKGKKINQVIYSVLKKEWKNDHSKQKNK